MLIPIRAEIRTRRPPRANHVLIALNILIFLYTDMLGGAAIKQLYMLDAAWPSLWQYISYQFLHGDIMHLLGNMLFLWIFGNAVCDRMGPVVYVMFYLAGGVAAGMTFAYFAENPLLGASGSIAAVTAAFLVLFPRVNITMLLFFWIITFIEIPAIWVILFKIILWDNVIAPLNSGMVSNVAHSAHLGGYGFGIAVGLLLLGFRALPRNPFDLIGLWTRWQRRSGYVPSMGGGGGGSTARRPRQVRPSIPFPDSASEAGELSPVIRLRERILDAIEDHRLDDAVALYHELLTTDPKQVLPRRQQLEIANQLKVMGQMIGSADAYERFLAAYPSTPEAPQVRLLAALICNRYLDRPQRAAELLRNAVDHLTVEAERGLALQELRDAEARLSGPNPPPAPPA